MRAYGTKRVTPVWADYRPREIVVDGVTKIAGWHPETRSGEEVEWSNTYNDRIEPGTVIAGQTEQTADYVQASGDSTQNGTPMATAPIPITPYVTGGTYRLPGTNKEITIPADMHGIAAVLDMVVWDRLSNRCWFDDRCGKNIFNGMETWLDYNPYATRFLPHLASSPILCTHFPNKNNDGVLWANATYLSINYINSGFASINTFKSFLVATPVAVVYQLPIPTRTYLTVTDNPNSTAPELPMEALEIIEPSDDYPFGVYNAGPHPVASVNADGSQSEQITIPRLRSVKLPADATNYTYIDDNDVKQYADTLTDLGGGDYEYQQRINPAIDDCTTDNIDVVYADYMLSPLPDPVVQHLGELPTFPRSTRLVQLTDGVKAWITATAKVMD
jgi:hypothetical protein